MTGRSPVRRSGDLCIIPAAAVFDDKLSHADIRILAALSTYADKSGRCWPSVATLAERTGICERHVRTCLRDLEQTPFLVIEKRPGQSSIYRMPLHCAAGVPRHGSAEVEANPCTGVHLPRHCGAGHPGTPVPPNDTNNDTNNDYAFDGKVIRLTPGDLDKWATAYSSIDLRAELQALDDWYDANLDGDARTNWFQRCSQALNKKNRQARTEQRATNGTADSDTIY